MSRIGLGCRRNPPSHEIELPHQPGIALPSLGRCDLPDSVVPPKSTHATESWDAAFRAYACSGENEDAVGGANREHQEKFTDYLRGFDDFLNLSEAVIQEQGQVAYSRSLSGGCISEY